MTQAGRSGRDIGLRERLVTVVDRELGCAASSYLDGGVLPRVFGGHLVGADAVADLIFALGGLWSAGVRSAGGRELASWIPQLLATVDGAATHTFASYRIAETLLSAGTELGAHPWTDRRDAERLAAAVDSSEWLELLDVGLPANYAAVLARCEDGRRRLGLLDRAGEDRLEALVERVRSLFDTAHGLVDDSGDGVGRVDMYAIDTVLFCEPLSARLGSVWSRSADRAATLVAAAMSENGAALCWGRSTGALAVVHLVEFAVLRARQTPEESAWWTEVAHHGIDRFEADRWVHNGLTTAHQHRSPYGYRGPARRLQLTFDLLGKLAWTAAQIDSDEAGDAPRDHSATLFGPLDSFVPVGDGVGVWAFRSDRLSLVVPFVGGSRPDYFAAPMRPGVFETPVDCDLVVGVPVIDHGGHRFAPSGRPERVTHRPGGVDATWSDFGRVGDLWSPDTTPPFAARRTARMDIDGAALVVEEALDFEDVPEAVSLVVAESSHRPLHVEVTGHEGTAVALRRIDVEGMAEWRSFWGDFRRVHEIEITPAPGASFAWRVTPKLKIASADVGHHYIDSFYGGIADDVEVRPLIARDGAWDPHVLDAVDAVHIHWPEWDLGWDVTDARRHAMAADSLTRHAVAVVWTAHNFEPHAKQPEIYRPIYAIWAGRADIVLHHSVWSRDQMVDRYRFRDDAVHVVIPHGHWGHLGEAAMTRREAERALDLPPADIRLGIVGAPRAEKDCDMAMAAMADSGRADVQLCVWSLRTDQEPPDDPRIVARTYAMEGRHDYETKLAACDALVFPFVDHTMAATGTVGDVIAHGMASLCSDWPFLHEHLGGAALVYGSTRRDLTQAIDRIDRRQLDTAAASAVARRAELSFDAAGRLSVEAFRAAISMRTGAARRESAG